MKPQSHSLPLFKSALKWALQTPNTQVWNIARSNPARIHLGSFVQFRAVAMNKRQTNQITKSPKTFYFGLQNKPQPISTVESD